MAAAPARRRAHTPRGQVVGAPAEQLDAEAERVPVGHAAHVAHGDRGRFGRARRRDRRARSVGVVGHAARRVDEEVDQAPQQADDLLGLAARGRPQVDALEVEGAERGERARGRLGHPDAAGAVDRVEHRVHERADLARRLAADDVARPPSGSSSGTRMPARTASSKSWQTYAMRSAHATTSPSGVDGAGRRHEWLRTPSSVSAHRFSGASVTSAP